MIGKWCEDVGEVCWYPVVHACLASGSNPAVEMLGHLMSPMVLHPNPASLYIDKNLEGLVDNQRLAAATVVIG